MLRTLMYLYRAKSTLCRRLERGGIKQGQEKPRLIDSGYGFLGWDSNSRALNSLLPLEKRLFTTTYTVSGRV